MTLVTKDVATWTNLGLLYLHHGDVELANEAFRRAQTLDPDYTLAWVGQGLIAAAQNQDREARTLFEHAVGLPTDVVRSVR
jgi:superkiller protein 3